MRRAAGLSREAASDLDLNARLDAARLYVITPDRDPDDIVTLVGAVLRGGAGVLQLRHKTLPRGQLLPLARRLRELTTAAGALFIVNDHVDVALIAGADGVHLGPDDLSVAAARRLGGEALIVGASASSLPAAKMAVSAGADYIGCGPAFTTPIKQEKSVIGPAGVAAVAAGAGVPVFAIGGIEESNLSELTVLGLRRACVIRAVSGAADPETATRRLRTMLDA